MRHGNAHVAKVGECLPSPRRSAKFVELPVSPVGGREPLPVAVYFKWTGRVASPPGRQRCLPPVCLRQAMRCLPPGGNSMRGRRQSHRGSAGKGVTSLCYACRMEFEALCERCRVEGVSRSRLFGAYVCLVAETAGLDVLVYKWVGRESKKIFLSRWGVRR